MSLFGAKGMTNEEARRAAKLLDEFGTEGALCDSEIQDLRAVERLVQAAYAAGAAAAKAEEREACADKTGEFARKWWSIHCASNKHMETTRKAHDDFCALQAAIRARSQS